jgi:hypothetical protein
MKLSRTLPSLATACVVIAFTFTSPQMVACVMAF